MKRRVLILSVLCAGAAANSLSAVQDLSHKDADRMEQKLALVAARAEVAKTSRPELVRTSFTEREINAYLKFNIHEQLPKGVLNPQVSIAGDRRISGHAIVDLDEIRKSKERSWLDPTAWLLTGSVQVNATGLLTTSGGKGTFQLESATIGTLAVPKSLLQELVSYYSRSTDLPGGFDLDKPFELPAKIREVEIQRGAATVIQQ